jgi:hypothetical protein
MAIDARLRKGSKRRGEEGMSAKCARGRKKGERENQLSGRREELGETQEGR